MEYVPGLADATRFKSTNDDAADGCRVPNVIDVEPVKPPGRVRLPLIACAGKSPLFMALQRTSKFPPATTELLAGLGFQTMLCYEKRRESWDWRNCIVELDEPAGLGLFIEIEGPESDTIRAVQSDLHLQHLEPVNVSYVGMLVAYCEAQGIGDRTVRFSDSTPR